MQNVYPKLVFMAIFDHFQPPNPLKSPLYRELSTSKGLYFSRSLHKLVLQETVLIFQCYEMEMCKMYPKVLFLVILTIFAPPPLTHSKTLYTTNEVYLSAHILPKVFIN